MDEALRNTHFEDEDSPIARFRYVCQALDDYPDAHRARRRAEQEVKRLRAWKANAEPDLEHRDVLIWELDAAREEVKRLREALDEDEAVIESLRDRLARAESHLAALQSKESG